MLPPVADRFVAGEDADAALAYAERLEQRGLRAILNRLGEHHEEREAVDEDVATYCELVDRIADRGLEAVVSAKPTQLGLEAGRGVFESALEDVVDAASAADVRLWLDMEAPPTVPATLSAFRDRAAEVGDAIGVCMQANLARTEDDVTALGDTGGGLRLVKGAYTPPEGEGFRDRDVVDEAYRRCMETAFAHWDGPIAVATHDVGMIDEAERLGDRYGREFQVQMLMGVREDDQERLARVHDVAQYVPFGPEWMRYFYRRARERKENLLFALKAVLHS